VKEEGGILKSFSLSFVCRLLFLSDAFLFPGVLFRGQHAKRLFGTVQQADSCSVL